MTLIKGLQNPMIGSVAGSQSQFRKDFEQNRLSFATYNKHKEFHTEITVPRHNLTRYVQASLPKVFEYAKLSQSKVASTTVDNFGNLSCLILRQVTGVIIT